MNLISSSLHNAYGVLEVDISPPGFNRPAGTREYVPGRVHSIRQKQMSFIRSQIAAHYVRLEFRWIPFLHVIMTLTAFSRSCNCNVQELAARLSVAEELIYTPAAHVIRCMCWFGAIRSSINWSFSLPCNTELLAHESRSTSFSLFVRFQFAVFPWKHSFPTLLSSTHHRIATRDAKRRFCEVSK